MLFLLIKTSFKYAKKKKKKNLANEVEVKDQDIKIYLVYWNAFG